QREVAQGLVGVVRDGHGRRVARQRLPFHAELEVYRAAAARQRAVLADRRVGRRLVRLRHALRGHRAVVDVVQRLVGRLESGLLLGDLLHGRLVDPAVVGGLLGLGPGGLGRRRARAARGRRVRLGGGRLGTDLLLGGGL